MNNNSKKKWLFSKRPFGAPLSSALLFIAIGIILWGGFNWSLELTNTEEFCISCHEMRDNSYMEYKKSIHFNNPSGVRATCPDCHVPRDWIHKVARKIKASNELIHHFLGSIDSREKFLENRHELAKHVWKVMKETDSRECRNCHSEKAMKLSGQREIAAQLHAQARGQNKTCIDCHKGIAHKLPEDFLEEEHERFEQEKVPCYQCHEEMARPETDDDW
ncbi:MAG TPA: cytochrome C, partial [Gammaproteobacteria bacterium]|nr:cytochrome C [Gammaproteobacteria bacterium]